jgi:hypothetical protein
MQHPAFQSFPRLTLYIGACILSGLTLILCQFGLIQVSFAHLWTEGLIFGLIFGILAYLLWFVVGFANFSDNQPLQKVVNYVALLLLTLGIWMGAGFLSLYILFPESIFHEFSRSFFLIGVYGLFLFVFVIRFYTSQVVEEDDTDEAAYPSEALDRTSPVAPEKTLEKISVKTGQKIHVIGIPEILFLQAEGDYVMIQATSGRFIKEQTMKYFEENLPSNLFIRIHRSCIVNATAISRIELYEKQNYRITLHSGHQLKASVAGYRLLKQHLQL